MGFWDQFGFSIDMALAVLFRVLKNAVKSKQAKKDMKQSMLKLRNAINDLYADDPDFTEES